MGAITHSTPSDATMSSAGAAAWDAEHTISLTASDVGADPAGTASGAITAHLADTAHNHLTGAEYDYLASQMVIDTPTEADYGFGITINSAYTGGGIVNGVSPTRAILINEDPTGNQWYEITADEYTGRAPTWVYYAAGGIQYCVFGMFGTEVGTRPLFFATTESHIEVGSLPSFILVDERGADVTYTLQKVCALAMPGTADVGATVQFFGQAQYTLIMNHTSAPVSYDTNMNIGTLCPYPNANDAYTGLALFRRPCVFEHLVAGGNWQTSSIELLNGNSGSDGWGNNPVQSSNGRFQRYSLSQAEYIRSADIHGWYTWTATATPDPTVGVNGDFGLDSAGEVWHKEAGAWVDMGYNLAHPSTTAANVSYDHTTSALTATTAQGAIDEVASVRHSRQHSVTSTSDHTFPGGTTTFLRADGSFAAPPGGGGDGGFAFKYGFSTSTDGTTGMGTGVIQYNNATPANATMVYIYEVDASGVTIDQFIDEIDVGDWIMFSNADKSIFHVFVATSTFTSGPASDAIPLLYKFGSAGNFSSGDTIYFSRQPAEFRYKIGRTQAISTFMTLI